MHSTTLKELPAQPPGKSGWPWADVTPVVPPILSNGSSWPRISIVVPSYNQSVFLEETLRSILLQGYPELELIVVDGGSKDNSVEIIRKYEPFLAFWVSEPDKGQSEAINKGFARATGDLITFLGSDDCYLPGTLQDVAWQWKTNPGFGAVIGGFCVIDEASKVVGKGRPAHLSVETPYDLTLGPPGIYRLHQVSTFFTRHALDAVGRQVRNDLQYTMDRELLYRIAGRYRIQLSEFVYGAFRRHPASKSEASILPFAEEFARMTRSFLNGNPDEDRQRRFMASYHEARGYIKYAQATPNTSTKLVALVRALRYRPIWLVRRSYWRQWRDVVMRRTHPFSFNFASLFN